jgi:hypothetical protein
MVNMSIRVRCLLSALVAGLLAFAPNAVEAQTDFINTAKTTLTVNVVAPPSSVLDGDADGSADAVFTAFEERTDHVLTQDIRVDAVHMPGHGFPLQPTSMIPAGTRVNSYYLHLDWASGEAVPLRRLVGEIWFRRDILGIIARKSNLDASDGELGATGTVYDPDQRGFEDGEALSLIGEPKRIAADLAWGGVGLDDIRVLTLATADASVPEPASATLFVAGGLAAIVLRRRLRS